MKQAGTTCPYQSQLKNITVGFVKLIQLKMSFTSPSSVISTQKCKEKVYMYKLTLCDGGEGVGCRPVRETIACTQIQDVAISLILGNDATIGAIEEVCRTNQQKSVSHV